MAPGKILLLPMYMKERKSERKREGQKRREREKIEMNGKKKMKG